jgi:hypothetical protein
MTTDDQGNSEPGSSFDIYIRQPADEPAELDGQIAAVEASALDHKSTPISVAEDAQRLLDS